MRSVRILLFLWFAGFATTPKIEAVSFDPNSSNTLARFEILRGTNLLGQLDVELFDRDKPQTVQNFLLYVRSGAYSNMFLHRAIPGFIVQGGGFTVTNPLAVSRFEDFHALPSLGRLANEFSTGPRLSNTFGTIAMAKVGGNPDSATSQWFFNLANNTTNLDEQNGGFTVFGRVLESTNATDGTNVLQHFNTLAQSAGIVNLSTLLGTTFSAFSDLPVTYTNTGGRAPSNSELYYTRITVLNQTNTPGPLPPTVTLLSPEPNLRFTNQLVTLRGTASDDAGVARVVYHLEGGPLEIASGTTNWEAAVEPFPGFNTVTVESIDCDGHHSTNAPSVTFFYVATVPLDLQVFGGGKVLGPTNGQSLQVGRYYTFTARTPARHFFNGWSGAVTSANASITFQVPATATNVSLTARFSPNPFPQLAGTYHGLFRATTSPTLDDSGFLTMSVRADGSFHGRILHRGGRYSFANRFDHGGNSAVQGNVGGVNRTLTLRLNLTNAAGIITGSLLGGSGTPEVQLERIASRLSAEDSPPAGRYTFAMTVNTTNRPSQLIPGGAGFGLGKLARAGTLRLKGTLPDGAAFAESTRLSRAGRWPLYVPLANGRGILIGWLAVATNDTHQLNGSLQWLRQSGSEFAHYPGGFTNQLSMLASAYSQPTIDGRVLNWTNGIAQLNGGLLELGITNHVELAENNVLNVVDDSTGLNFSFDLKTGLVNGSFVHPWAGTTNLLRGVILQTTNTIRGQFLDGDQTGDLEVHAAP